MQSRGVPGSNTVCAEVWVLINTQIKTQTYSSTNPGLVRLKALSSAADKEP